MRSVRLYSTGAAFAGLLLAATLLAASLSCGRDGQGGEAGEVTIGQLTSSPERYDGKPVRTEGFYLSAFETSALGESTYRQGEVVYLTGPAIWLDPGAIESREDCFQTATVPPIEVCKVKVAGYFEYGEGYGHLSAYRYQITARR